eukprot:2923362-Prymnesium_polylepis.1
MAAPAANLALFDQAPFKSRDNNGTAAYNETMPHVTGLAPAGHVYVPTRCRAPGGPPCRLHFSLHGCGVDRYYDDA